MADDSIASEFERLARLRDKGVITEAEFAKAKAKLLGVEPAGQVPGVRPMVSAADSKPDASSSDFFAAQRAFKAESKRKGAPSAVGKTPAASGNDQMRNILVLVLFVVVAPVVVISLYCMVTSVLSGRIAEERRVEAAAERMLLADQFSHAVAGLRAHCESASQYFIEGEYEDAAREAEPVSSAIRKYQGIPGIEEIEALFAGPGAAIRAFHHKNTALDAVEADDYLLAGQEFIRALALLEGLPEPLLGSAGVHQLKREIERAQRRSQRKIDAAIDEDAVSLLLEAVCGAEAPTMRSAGGGGGSYAVEYFVKRQAHDPRSVESSNCTRPVLTDSCWMTTCDVRAKNLLGAMALSRNTYFIARPPSGDSTGLVVEVR